MGNTIEKMVLQRYIKVALPWYLNMGMSYVIPGWMDDMLKNETVRQIDLVSDSLSYLRYGEYHRIDQPSYISSSMFMTWDQYGAYHRKDGPAIIWRNGKKNYYIRGEHVEI